MLSLAKVLPAVLGMCLMLSTSTRAASANDFFSHPEMLTGTNVTVRGDNSNASTEPDENTGSGLELMLYSVWYSWTPPADGVIHLSATTSIWNFYPSVRVFRGETVAALALSPAGPDGTVRVAANETVFIQVASIIYSVWGGGGATGPFTLSLSLEVPRPTSSNDAFANRLPITVPSYHFEGGIYGATSDFGEPLPSPELRRTLWWTIVPTQPGVLTLSVVAPQFSSRISVYEGDSLGSMTGLTATRELSSSYLLQTGLVYSIQMACAEVATGNFSLESQFHSLSNDMFAGSLKLEGNNITAFGNADYATFEPGEPDPGAANTIWFSWAATATGRASVSPSPDWWRPMAIYQGPTLDRLVPVRVAPSGNSVADFLAEEGTVYHLQYAGGSGDFAVSIQFQPYLPSRNDQFADAHIWKGNAINPWPAKWFPATDATLEPGEPAHFGDSPAKSLWWKWQAPVHGSMTLWPDQSLLTNFVLAIYQGSAVEALTLVTKGTNWVTFPVTGGETYCIAAAAPADAVGDISFTGGVNPSSFSRTVPGNLLKEPSWEGTALDGVKFWKMSGSIGGYVGEYGGADGTTWPLLGEGAKIWQDFATIPGTSHGIRFALRFGGDLSHSVLGPRIRVLWDNRELGIAEIASDEPAYWHWADFTVYPSNTTSRLTLMNLGGNVEVDAFSVVPLMTTPVIVTQPKSVSTFEGGAASFLVGTQGTPPLAYQWFLDGRPLPGQTASTLSLESVLGSQAGSYWAVISNRFGSVTSAPAALHLETPKTPTIVLQPYGDTVALGSRFPLTVAAVGPGPLSYQWFFNGDLLLAATNRYYVLDPVQTAQAGSYAVKVWSPGVAVWSLPARVDVTSDYSGGGAFWFGNEIPDGGFTRNAFVFDVDGATKLNGSRYAAQLYAGPSLALIRAVGEPRSFLTGFEAGLIDAEAVVLPTVSPLTSAFVQVRAWETARGASYEEARALGSKFGRSDILQITPGIMPYPPPLWGLQSFNLEAGLPSFVTGIIRFVKRQPGGVVVWEHQGEPGFRYVIEKSIKGFQWLPFLVVTNQTSVVTFTDSANSGANVVFYRSRILD